MVCALMCAGKNLKPCVTAVSIPHCRSLKEGLSVAILITMNTNKACALPGASTGDPTHDKVIRERPDRQGGIRTRGTPRIDPTHDKVIPRDLTGKADQDSRDPLDLLEHLPPNQNLSIFLSYAFRQTLLILMGAVPDHLSLREINLEL